MEQIPRSGVLSHGRIRTSLSKTCQNQARSDKELTGSENSRSRATTFLRPWALERRNKQRERLGTSHHLQNPAISSGKRPLFGQIWSKVVTLQKSDQSMARNFLDVDGFGCWGREDVGRRRGAWPEQGNSPAAPPPPAANLSLGYLESNVILLIYQ